MSRRNGNFPHINAITDELLFKVVGKLSSKERVTFRQTCKSANKFVEEKGRFLSKIGFQNGTNLLITSENRDSENLQHLHFQQSVLSTPKPVADLSEKNLSGLAIKELKLANYHHSLPFEECESFLKRFNFHVYRAIFWMDQTQQEMLTLSESIDVHHLCYTPLRSDDLRESLAIFKKSRNASKLYIFTICREPPRETDEILESMTYFRKFHISIFLRDTSFFHSFISKLYRMRGCNLKSSEFHLYQITASDLYDSDLLPRMSIIFDLKSFEFKFNALETVRMLKTEDRLAIIHEEQNDQSVRVHVELFKIDDDGGIFDYLMKTIPLNNYFKDKKTLYINSNAEERFELLRMGYWETCMKAGDIPQSQEFVPYKDYLKKHGLSDTRNL